MSKSMAQDTFNVKHEIHAISDNVFMTLLSERIATAIKGGEWRKKMSQADLAKEVGIERAAVNGFEKEVKNILAQNGWALFRAAKGSHEYWTKKGQNPITVPHGCKSRHTANAIMKSAKIKYKF